MQSTASMGDSRLMALPKELRLEIWSHVLTDVSKGRRVLCILREIDDPDGTAGKRYPNSTYKDSDSPGFSTCFEHRSASHVGVSLLRTNRLVYLEALPILYHSTTFALWDPDGSFPLFLERLSPFAKSHIRYVGMGSHRVPWSSARFFYWALACAQVAKLNGSLRLVEVGGDLLHLEDGSFQKRAIVYPLLKIKAPKKLLNGCDVKFQHALAEAAADLDARTDERKALTAADFADGTRLANLERFDYDHPIKRPRLENLPHREKGYECTPTSSIDERELAHDMAIIPGIEKCKSELYQWDMVSNTIAAPNLNSQTTSIISASSAGRNPPALSDSQGGDSQDSQTPPMVGGDVDSVSDPTDSNACHEDSIQQPSLL
jgi:hypothetical protein